MNFYGFICEKYFPFKKILAQNRNKDKNMFKEMQKKKYKF